MTRALILFFALQCLGCNPQTSGPDASQSETSVSETSSLGEALTLYASFDGGFSADFALGDAMLYTAPDWQSIDEAKPVLAGDLSVSRMPDGGRSGGALRFHSDWDPIVFFFAENNIAYRPENWSGAFSFWLRVVPDEELEEGYSDPFIVTDKNWDDASLYVDFTESDRPRRFRFAAFSDKSIWNPDGISWDDVPIPMRPMVDVESEPFAGGEWTHVVLSFENINGAGNGRMIGYLNGEKAGELADRPLSITWNITHALMALGRHYRGAFDELAVFNRALSEEEVLQLYREVDWFSG